MEIGGNGKFKQYLDSQGLPASMALEEKYNSKAAEWYRNMISARVEGKADPEPLTYGEGAKAAYVTPARSVTSSISSANQGTGAISGGPARYTSAPRNHTNWDEADPLGSFLSGAASAATSFGGWMKSTAQNTVQKAQEEGWVDSITENVKHAGGWVLDKSKEAVHTVTDDHFMDRVKDSADWFGSQMGISDQGRGDRAADYLSGLSSGKMQGFSYECPPAGGSGSYGTSSRDTPRGFKYNAPSTSAHRSRSSTPPLDLAVESRHQGEQSSSISTTMECNSRVSPAVEKNTMSSDDTCKPKKPEGKALLSGFPDDDEDDLWHDFQKK